MCRYSRNSLILLAVLALTPPGCQSPPGKTTYGPISFATVLEDFELDEPGEAWTLATPQLWRIAVESNRRFLQMAYPAQRPTAPDRQMPGEYALYQAYQFRSFTMTCRLRVDSEPARQGRNACILFGWQDPKHYYYARLANLSDERSNGVFCVDGEQVKPLPAAGAKPPPAITDQGWHKVDVLRDAKAGTIEVYVDAYQENQAPLFKVTDRRYEWGHIGVGAVDDHASFYRLWFEGEARKVDQR